MGGISQSHAPTQGRCPDPPVSHRRDHRRQRLGSPGFVSSALGARARGCARARRTGRVRCATRPRQLVGKPIVRRIADRARSGRPLRRDISIVGRARRRAAMPSRSAVHADGLCVGSGVILHAVESALLSAISRSRRTRPLSPYGAFDIWRRRTRPRELPAMDRGEVTVLVLLVRFSTAANSTF